MLCATTSPDLLLMHLQPPDLISGIITESGVLTPSAVSEELIKIWF
jgi:translation initiation factor 2B subunit (eIF-2B alpha/beta/delta family)